MSNKSHSLNYILGLLLLFLLKPCISSRPRDPYLARACENYFLELYCPDGQVIDVITARYGRWDAKICSYGFRAWDPLRNHLEITDNLECGEDHAEWTRLVAKRCNNRQGCIFLATNCVDGDPCVGNYKYSEAEYHCIDSAAIKEEEEEKPMCLLRGENCERIFGPTGLPLPCCGDMSCEYGYCVKCRENDGDACTQDRQCCGEDNFCIDGTCTRQPLPLDPLADGIKFPINANIKVARACENYFLELYCPDEHVVNVLSARYGRWNLKYCSSKWAPGCPNLPDEVIDSDASINEGWQEVLSKKCNNRQGCVSMVSYWVDGYVGDSVYAEAEYECLPAGSNGKKMCLPKNEDCSRVSGPTGEQIPCCGGMSCEYGHCVECLGRREPCSDHHECCGNDSYCIQGQCSYDPEFELDSWDEWDHFD